MKRAVILHGTDATAQEPWILWLKSQLEARGFMVWAPEMPGNHTPNRQVYNDFLFGQGWDFTNNLVIGHSSGAVAVLNLLSDARCPKLAAGVLLSVWYDSSQAHLDIDGLSPEQFSQLFPSDGFDFGAITNRTGRLLLVHGDDDPYCPLDQAKELARQTGSDLVVIPGGGHLGARFPEFPQLIHELKARQLI